MRGKGRKFFISREGRTSQYQAMVEQIADDGFREIAISIHRDRQCIADVYITVDEETLEPVVYLTADGNGNDDHDIIVRPLKSKTEAVVLE